VKGRNEENKYVNDKKGGQKEERTDRWKEKEGKDHLNRLPSNYHTYMPVLWYLSGP
jgi:hypothetical protein